MAKSHQRKSGRNKRAQDHFARRAKREGNAARSYYKLEEIDKKSNIIRPGTRVLDLGCSPGSWMQYTARRVGEKGQVLGYDLKPVETTLPAHAEARVGDIYEISLEELGGLFHVIVSDMAPSTTGNRATDHLRSAALVERALDIADSFLKTGGSVVAKLLEGGEIEALVKRMRQSYKKVERHRPKATRKESTEVFLVGIGKNPSEMPE